MCHASENVIKNLKKSTKKVKVIKSENDEIFIINQCEICALFKTHKIIFKSSDKKKTSKAFFHRIIYDLMLLTPILNKN